MPAGTIDLLILRYLLAVSAADVLAYIGAIAAHPAYTARFQSDLVQPGLRIPLTASATLFGEAVRLGKELIDTWSSPGSSTGSSDHVVHQRPRHCHRLGFQRVERPRQRVDLIVVGAAREVAQLLQERAIPRRSDDRDVPGLHLARNVSRAPGLRPAFPR